MRNSRDGNALRPEGPVLAQLSKRQRALDREVRLEISRELGHEREQITATYLGR